MTVKRILAVYLLYLSRTCLAHPLFLTRQNPIPLEDLPPLPRISDVLHLSKTDESILQNFQYSNPGVKSIPIDLDSLSDQISNIEKRLAERRFSRDLVYSPYSFGKLLLNSEPLDTPIDTEFIDPPSGFPKPIPEDVEIIVPPPPPQSEYCKMSSLVKRDATTTSEEVSTTLRALSGSQLEREIILRKIDPAENEIKIGDTTKYPDENSSISEEAATPTTMKTDSSSDVPLSDAVDSAKALDHSANLGVDSANLANPTLNELLSIILKKVDLKDNEMKMEDATKNSTLSVESAEPSTVKVDGSSDESIRTLGSLESTTNSNIDIAKPAGTSVNGSSPISETGSLNVTGILDEAKLILVEPASIVTQQSKPVINSTASDASENEIKWQPMSTGIFIPYAQNPSYLWNSLNVQELTQLLGGVAQNFNNMENQIGYQNPPPSYYYYPQLANLNFRYIPHF